MGVTVSLVDGEWRGRAGVVSWPITPDTAGYVLIHVDGRIAGVQAGYRDVLPAPDSEGFTQLTSQLIKLSSLLIESAILPQVR
jgi:hypothetical protein